MEPAEVRQAIKLLDKNSDGLISFEEFVDWWVNEVRAHHFLAAVEIKCSEGHIRA